MVYLKILSLRGIGLKVSISKQNRVGGFLMINNCVAYWKADAHVSERLID